VLLLEAIVDRAADGLERIRDEMDDNSRRLFQGSAQAGPRKNDNALAATLRFLGQTGDAVSRLRDSLLALGRIVGFVGHTAGWLPPDLRSRLDVVRRDVDSLSDYDNHLANKTQFLLDATLGFINIEQNHVIKVLAVVGTVGVPPTLIASIYGMNFEHMPELHFWFAYPVALLAILVSALLPLAWFKRRGWL
jgi:magnesium transporter